MAQEITVNLNGTINVGGLRDQIFPPGSVKFDSSVSLADKVVKSVSTADVSLTALLVNTATIEGLLYIENLDATNYVKIGPTSGGAIVPFARINAGKAALIPLEPGLTLRIQANTAACKCDIRLYAGNGSAGA